MSLSGLPPVAGAPEAWEVALDARERRIALREEAVAQRERAADRHGDPPAA